MEDQALQSSRWRYRPDIDGLRAVAVTLVVLDHLRTRLLGGFVGVDVFFVISGYLISGHILASIAAGNFSLVAFYERRVRRILPALLVMMAVCGLVAYWLLAPVDLEKYAWSMLSALFSVSNLYFREDTNYFAGLTSAKPLLHTWSLGVEEQFYLLFPLLLLLLVRIGRRWLQPAIWTMLLTSFAASCWYVTHDATVAFYLLPVRAWELLLGTVLSQDGYLPRLRGVWSRNVASALGLLAILSSAYLLSPVSSFPAWNALGPCLGASLIIRAGEDGDSLVAKLLSLRPVVFVGLISYSLYLWHWPVIVFGSMSELTHMRKITVGLKVIWAALSLVLAVFSWALVEQPFRRGRLRPRRRTLFAIAGAAVGTMAVLGVIAIRTDGVASRFSPEVRSIMAYRPLGGGFRDGACFFTPPEQFSAFNEKECLGIRADKPQVLLVGDSMAAQLYLGLLRTFPEWNVSQITSAGCAPILSMKPRLDGLFLYNCQEMLDRTRIYLSTHRPALVLLAGDWREDELGPLIDTINWLHEHGQSVVLYGPPPAFDADLPGLIGLASRRAHPEEFLASHREPWVLPLDRQMASLAAERWKVPYISAFDMLCTVRDPKTLTSGDGCPVIVAPGVPLQWDFHHFGPETSVLYAQAVREHHLLAP